MRRAGMSAGVLRGRTWGAVWWGEVERRRMLIERGMEMLRETSGEVLMEMRVLSQKEWVSVGRTW